jgi:hypothetical protein
VGGRSPGFVAELGFVPRVDVHAATQTLTYTSRPARALSDWGPTVLLERVWAHDGTPLDWRARSSMAFNFQRSTSLLAFVEATGVTLRPGDAPNLAGPLEFRPDTWGLVAGTSPRPSWSASVDLTAGRAINFEPAGDRVPALGDHLGARLAVGIRPLTPLRIDNTWLRTSLTLDGRRAFVTDIVRTQWAWQFTREWSLRFIGQYDATTANQALVTIAPRRNLNADVLLTRLVNPWTALYVGVNSNRQDLALVESAAGTRVLQRTSALNVDAWQVFVKWSHLIRW